MYPITSYLSASCRALKLSIRIYTCMQAMQGHDTDFLTLNIPVPCPFPSTIPASCSTWSDALDSSDAANCCTRTVWANGQKFVPSRLFEKTTSCFCSGYTKTLCTYAGHRTVPRPIRQLIDATMVPIIKPRGSLQLFVRVFFLKLHDVHERWEFVATAGVHHGIFRHI